MSATTLIIAAMRRTPNELRAALRKPEKAAADHGVPVAWVRHYVGQELGTRA